MSWQTCPSIFNVQVLAFYKIKYLVQETLKEVYR